MISPNWKIPATQRCITQNLTEESASKYTKVLFSLSPLILRRGKRQVSYPALCKQEKKKETTRVLNHLPEVTQLRRTTCPQSTFPKLKSSFSPNTMLPRIYQHILQITELSSPKEMVFYLK